MDGYHCPVQQHDPRPLMDIKLHALSHVLSHFPIIFFHLPKKHRSNTRIPQSLVYSFKMQASSDILIAWALFFSVVHTLPYKSAGQILPSGINNSLLQARAEDASPPVPADDAIATIIPAGPAYPASQVISHLSPILAGAIATSTAILNPLRPVATPSVLPTPASNASSTLKTAGALSSTQSIAYEINDGDGSSGAMVPYLTKRKNAWQKFKDGWCKYLRAWCTRD